MHRSPLPWERGWGRGLRVAELARDHLADRLHVSHHFVVPKTDHAIALCREPSGTPFVVLVPFTMLSAIDFYDEAGGVADEVGYIRSHRDLAPELAMPETPCAQVIPEPPFRLGHARAQLPRVFEGRARTEAGEARGHGVNNECTALAVH